MAKKAVLIGCNYPGTKIELRGCVNDVTRMHNSLIERYGFSDDDITVLIDTDHSGIQPTGKNIRSAIKKMVRSAEPGDVLFIHYSGHGTRLPAETGEADDTGYDECIVPCDMNLIIDEDFREFVKEIPRGCRVTIVADSCHSGGLIREPRSRLETAPIQIIKIQALVLDSEDFFFRRWSNKSSLVESTSLLHFFTVEEDIMGRRRKGQGGWHCEEQVTASLNAD